MWQSYCGQGFPWGIPLLSWSTKSGKLLLLVVLISIFYSYCLPGPCWTKLTIDGNFAIKSVIQWALTVPQRKLGKDSYTSTICHHFTATILYSSFNNLLPFFCGNYRLSIHFTNMIVKLIIILAELINKQTFTSFHEKKKVYNVNRQWL